MDPHSEVLSRSERLVSVLVERDENKSKVIQWLSVYFSHSLADLSDLAVSVL